MQQHRPVGLFNLFVHLPAIFAALALSLALLSPAAAAAPEYARHFFNDFSGKVDDDAASRIDNQLEQASKDSRIHVMLVVVQRMSDHAGMPQDIREFAAALAREWRVGNAENGKGMLLVFSLGDRKYHVVKTKNLPVSLTDRLARGMRGEVTLALSQGKIAQAMQSAASQIAKTLPRDASTPLGETPVAVPSTSRTAERSGSGAFAPMTKTSHNAARPHPRVEYDARTRSSGGFGWVVLIIGGIIFFVVVMAIVGAFSSARTFRGGGYHGAPYGGYGHGGYGGGYSGGFGGGNLLTGMLLGGMLGNLFGGRSGGGSAWGSSGGGGGWSAGSSGSSFGSWGDSGGSWGGSGGDWGGSSWTSSGGDFGSFGGGDFGGGSSGGEW